ncbi:Cupin [Geosmithia morbida]|uniref:Cupin n=1 Tax=Geosmithia morbida TaxID=1094350 RepID=A0A9P4YXQ4_9HYPO|nr:Cupin [Geosmithia morbida]KAF4124785.1 Cupin [Geosmithia morbida]
MPALSDASVTPLSSLRVSRHLIPAHGLIPNTSLQDKPLLIYHSAFAGSPSAEKIESHLRSLGVVEPQWQYSMYSTTHFHSTTHEVLCVSAGRARLCFGGEENDGRVEVDVSPGDVIVVPAGVGHRLLREEGGGAFQMVGCYPVGNQQWDMCYGNPSEKSKIDGIASLPWFKRDPVYGAHGPATLE